MGRAGRVGRVTAAAGVVAALTGGLTLVASGVLGSPDPDDPGAGPLGPVPAAAAALTPFRDCDQLLDWYVERTLPLIGPYGLDGPVVHGAPDVQFEASGAVEGDVSGSAQEAPTTRADASLGQGSSATGTNVQEVGVDEPDLVKTDGRLLVRLTPGRLVVLDVTGDEPRELGTLTLPDALTSPELLLAGDRVLLVQSGGPVVLRQPLPLPVEPPVEPLPAPSVEELPGPSLGPDLVDPPPPEPELPPQTLPAPYPVPDSERARLVTVSIDDPSSPRVESDLELGGSLLATRQYDGADGSVVRLALRTGAPTLDWVTPNRSRTFAEAKEANKQIVRESSIADWLPSVDDGSGSAEQLVGCGDVSHPVGGEETSTLTVVTMATEDVTDLRAVALTGAGETLYSSQDRLYLTSPDVSGAGEEEGGTEIHAFALEGLDTTYVASGTVAGRLRDRWSMDEHEGVLRVALAHGAGWSPSDNGVTTLREQGEELVELGTVRGLGPQEEIMSVRWFDDLAVVVTFRQTDPLYTVDLTDPSRPRALGALKIPGFSRYLHPIGDDRLLGIGQDADDLGQTLGAQAAVFDVTDLTRPVRLDQRSFGPLTHAGAEDDPRAFTWLGDRETALTSVTDQRTGRASLSALRVGPEGRLTETSTWDLPGAGSTARTLPLADGRVAVVGATVVLIDIPR